jgi:hypothetical protein
MIYTTDCTVRINAQDPDYPTYVALDGTVHTNANDAGIHGVLLDATVNITTLLITACRNWNQGIRLVVTINNIDVSGNIIGNLNLQHNKNMISTFSLNLNDSQYSPRTNSNIDLDKVVVITAYINGQEKKLFTGTIDEPEAVHEPAFRVIVTGRDYGKKLLDKRTTVVSVQDLADSTKRNDLIKYLAELAGVTDYEIPEMDAVTIDNSFQDQSVWDMIQKEAMVEQYWVKFDEDGKMQLKLDDVKSDTDTWPTADWTYDEDRIIRIGYKKARPEINKITILGKTTQKRIPQTTTYMTSTGQSYDTPVTLFSDSLSFGDGDRIETNENLNYSKTIGDWTLIIRSYASGPAGNVSIRVGCKTQDILESYVVTNYSGVVGGNADLRSVNYPTYSTLDGISWYISRDGAGTNLANGQAGSAFTFNVTVTGYLNREDTPATYQTNTTYTTRYDQISATVTDPNSIAKYGELDGGSVEYPLLETTEQCENVGSRIIRDSHRQIGQVDFQIPFNPLVQTGQTISITDSKIGLTERYFVEGVNHDINISPDGKVKARTGIEGVLYV